YTAAGTALAGQYGNLATASGTDPIGQTPSDDDPSHYFGVNPAIQIVKLTNGRDNDAPTGPRIQVGNPVTWTYQVTNPGNVPLANVVVRDDNGTPADPSDDFSPAFVGGDANGNGLLDPGETWVYSASGIAQLGQYVNMGTVTATDDTETVPETVTDDNPDHYLGVEEPPVIVIGPDKNPGTPQQVKVVEADTGIVTAEFVAYENNYNGGIRVAVADLNGDGIDEIITAPGRNRAPEIRFFTLDGVPVPGFSSFLAYAAKFKGGVHVTVADVNGDGKPDIITVPSNGTADVRVFFNRHDPLNPSNPAFLETPDIAFRAFSKGTTGGFVVAAADMGRLDGTAFVNDPDGRAEIVIATGTGTKATVAVFEVSGFDTSGALRSPVRTFNPFTQVSTNFKGGVSLEVAKVDADPIPDIIVGMGVNGTSRIEVWTWNTSNASLSRTGVIPNAFTGSSYRAPVNVAAITDGNGFADTIVAVQGPNGTSREIRRFDIVNRSPLIFQPATPLTTFPGPWFVASSRDFTSTPSGPTGFRVAELTSLDDSPKFFVVDDRANNVFHYGSLGQHVNGRDFAAGQIQQRGVTTTADGSRVWVVDAKKVIRVFDASGALLGSWTAPQLKKPTGIATDGTNLWIVDQSRKLVYRFDNAAGVTSGSLNASSTFKLHKSNSKAEGITTDGDRLWVVDNGSKQDRVYVYSSTGQSLGSWLIDFANAVPTGLTIDPTSASQSIWIVDGQQAVVYEYADAKGITSGSQSASHAFALAAGNSSPQGIADPDVSLRRNRSEEPADAFLATDSNLGVTTATTSDAGLVQWLVAPLDPGVSMPLGSAVSAAGLTVADLLSSTKLNPTVPAIPEAPRLAPPDAGGFWQDLLEDLTSRGTGSQKSADDELFADLGWLEERMSGFPA
ncbi:MAG: FG-GAP repeat protein, partial [Pirellulaceae bacterium]|nr:FG-GAP repeat protein [Pirellulaceae bacterium]